MSDFLNNKVIPAVTKFAQFKFVRAMQAAVTAGLGATVVGSIFMIMMNPPFPADVSNVFIDAWRAWSAANASWLGLGYQVTLEFVGLYALIGMAVVVSNMNDVRPTNMVVISCASFLILSANLVEGNMAIGFLGAKGLVTALLVGYFVVELSCWLMKHGFKINLPEAVPPFVAEPLNALIVNIVVIAAVVAVRLIVGALSGGALLPAVINSLFAPLFVASDSLLAVVLYSVIVRLLWFFGLHGGNIAGAVMTPILSVTLIENATAFVNNEAMLYIFTQMFVQTWTVMGVLAIVIAMLIVCKSKQLKAISKVAIAPALFNIGEPITFGLPIVMNFKILVPYLLCFALDAAVPYLATSAGLINRSFVNIPYTVPAIFKAFLSTMDFRAVILYVVLLVVNVLIFIPWLKKYDHELLVNEEQSA
ncbi:PTS sugar transporter subunit IIC [Dielma fastidiosa]|uniref:PTS sugar transporter subunit IIC n=1 Tax=Dielma fastidiosa TaxID=1034346 RepID=UPI000E499AA9|nr:PTS transporter subunit EIIC [Dielma fastidiosa]RHM97475.1 PTS sugar transporter subunit IIC [Dielma fastidiosa]